MEKKIVIVALAVLMLASIVTAALLTYFGQITTTVTVGQAILLDSVENDYEVDDLLPLTVACGSATSTVSHTLKNQSTSEIPVEIVTTPPIDGITTTYVGTAELTKKTVTFGGDHWPAIDGKVTIEYTIVGDKFNATVTNGAQTGYELVYYKDNSDRWNEPAEVKRIASIDGKDLPRPGDRNWKEYDYCALDGYKTCHGAKIWYVPSSAIISGNELDWARASEFFYETELIQYNLAGDVILFPGETLDFKVVNDFDCALIPGTYTITTTIVPEA